MSHVYKHTLTLPTATPGKPPFLTIVILSNIPLPGLSIRV